MGERLSPVLFRPSEGSLAFECAACEMPHVIKIRGLDKSGHPVVWDWDGSVDRPTFQPSLLLRWEEGQARTPQCCHFFVRGGQIQYLDDCTHALAGKTVPIPEWNTAWD